MPKGSQHEANMDAKMKQQFYQNRQHIIKMAPNIDPESMKNQGFVADAFLERPWAPKG